VKRILITAADSAFGLKLIERYASCGLEEIEWIYATYYDCFEELNKLLEEYPVLKEKMFLRQVDMSKEENLQELVDDLDTKEAITHMVHLPAPKVSPDRFAKLTWDKSFAAHINISLKSAVIILQNILPRMSKQKNGNIVLMSSYYATEEGTPSFLSQYVTAKSAMIGLMRALDKEYSSKRIFINALAPDIADTKYLSDMPDLIKEQAAFNNPKGRILTADEVVDALLKLLENKEGISGKTVVVK